MGFYSFYRIFKDIFKTFFGKNGFKVFLVILLIIFAFTFFSSSVRASDLRPWNVWTNTTEFNWLRLTNINYTDNQTSLSYSFYNLSSEHTYYLYNPNSSTGSIRLYTYVSNNDNTLLMLYEDTSHTTSHWFEYQYKYNGGYCDIPFNKPFTPQFDCSISFGNNSSLELYMLDDKYSNIEAYNEIMATQEIIKSLFGVEGDGIDKDFVSINGLVASVSGNFTSHSSFNTIYFKVEQGTNYTLSFNASSTSLNDAIRFGYCSSVPSVGSSYNSFNHWGDVNNSNPINFSASYNSYYYVSYNNTIVSDLSLSSNKNLIDNINNQAQETRETLTDSNISQNSSDYTLPTDSTNDITNDGFTSIFDRIRTTFTNDSSSPATINVPFTNKSFTISKSSVFGSANLGVVQTIIEAFWWFVVSVFIVKDIFKKIEKIKTGNIEFTETTNIKEDIL